MLKRCRTVLGLAGVLVAGLSTACNLTSESSDELVSQSQRELTSYAADGGHWTGMVESDPPPPPLSPQEGGCTFDTDCVADDFACDGDQSQAACAAGPTKRTQFFADCRCDTATGLCTGVHYSAATESAGCSYVTFPALTYYYDRCYAAGGNAVTASSCYRRKTQIYQGPF